VIVELEVRKRRHDYTNLITRAIQPALWLLLFGEVFSGILISLARPPAQEQAAAHGVRAVFFIVQTNRAELAHIGELIDAGQLRPLVAEVLTLAQAGQAYMHKQGGRTPGKIVLQVVGEPSLV
jgi:NADPH:quinone reductase-like Zn-dependent oxidoreductase